MAEPTPRYCATCTWHDVRHHRVLFGKVAREPIWGLCWQRIPQILFSKQVDPESVRRDLGAETRLDETCGNWTPRLVVVRFAEGA